MSICPSLIPAAAALRDPWESAYIAGEGVVMALLVHTIGPSYRDAGAAMAILPDDSVAGTITSGCIEADLLARARALRQTGGAELLRYGLGSPFIDLRLPCGGGIDVVLFCLQDRHVIGDLLAARRERAPCSLRAQFTAKGGLRLSLAPPAATQWQPMATGGDFTLLQRPALRFVVFGTGAELVSFGASIRALGYDHLLCSHEGNSLLEAQAFGCQTQLISNPRDMTGLKIDRDTAVVLFYHNHDYEPDILTALAPSPAFYVGAQGSRAVHARRCETLAERGLTSEAISKIRGPIGLIPSSRDPRSLAVSVLAEVLEQHRHAV